MKRVYIATLLTSLVVMAAFIGCFRLLNLSSGKDHLKIGFIYDNDESTPYTYNFSLAKDAVEKKYGERVEILTCSNVLDDEMEEPLRELAGAGCDIIFFNGYSEKVMELAPEYPDIQFCQTSYMDMSAMTLRKTRPRWALWRRFPPRRSSPATPPSCLASAPWCRRR